VIVATTVDGDIRRFPDARAFARWYLAAPRGLVRVVDISAVNPTPEPEPAPRSNEGPVGHQAH
jgi:hypothetical protein